eukprot:CAMPEP_0178996358 /NCGR_PEP_ID=MMETSP0795-20121207/8327_1 /TAXON_ID=88552 /ORGANISM="Amoebophrya sp., Strain Ameob2" /LENGTH=175 /DNA_ID=CAMNT_0020688745 /DNA_START=224 /DNA_END=751 /DNA_ORIENTATION=-
MFPHRQEAESRAISSQGQFSASRSREAVRRLTATRTTSTGPGRRVVRAVPTQFGVLAQAGKDVDSSRNERDGAHYGAGAVVEPDQLRLRTLENNIPKAPLVERLAPAAERELLSRKRAAVRDVESCVSFFEGRRRRGRELRLFRRCGGVDRPVIVAVRHKHGDGDGAELKRIKLL